MSNSHTTAKPEHPLTADSETKLFRYVTHDDVVRWERIEFRYNNLIETLRAAVSDADWRSQQSRSANQHEQ